MTNGFSCLNCGTTQSSCWYGTKPNKYCKECIDVGKEAGHVKTLAKRARTTTSRFSPVTLDDGSDADEAPPPPPRDMNLPAGRICKVEIVYSARCALLHQFHV